MLTLAETLAVVALESSGVDSLWLPEIVYPAQIDPFAGMQLPFPGRAG
jgi:hypothetical protein